MNKFSKIITKIAALVLVVTVVVGSLPPIKVSAANPIIQSESGEFLYKVLNDGTANIVGFNTVEAELNIPETIDGYTVTRLDTIRDYQKP